MAQTTFVVSFLFGLALVATLGYVSARGWRRYSPPEGRSNGSSAATTAARVAQTPAAWVVAFLVAVLGFGGAAVAFVGGGGLPDGAERVATLFLFGATALVAVFYAFYGTFVSARGRGLKNSQAAALGSWVVGLLFVAAVVLKLAAVV
jgi:hypothetical protein